MDLLPTKDRPLCLPVTMAASLNQERGLTPTARILLVRLKLFALREGLAPPMVISGYRTVEEQAALREAWDRGEREGLAVRPAEDSAHTRGEAFDLGNPSAELPFFGEEAKRLGHVWGGDFLNPDPRHFQVG